MKEIHKLDRFQFWSRVNTCYSHQIHKKIMKKIKKFSPDKDWRRQLRENCQNGAKAKEIRPMIFDIG